MRKAQGKNMLNIAGVLSIVVLMLVSVVPAMATTNDVFVREPTVQTKTMQQQTLFGSEDALLSEGFEEGIMPPTGWTVINENTNRPWDIVDIQTYPDFIHGGTYAAWINYDSEFKSDNWLISPEIDVQNYSELSLNFWYISDTDWPGATVKVHVLGDGYDMVIWDLIEDENFSDFIYRAKTIDLSTYLPEGKFMQLAWQYIGFDGQSFGLDDIAVYESDITPPVTLCTLDGEQQGDVYIGDVTVTLTATDNLSGVKETKYKIDDGTWTTYTEPFIVSTYGDHTVYFYSIDNADNQETEKTETFTIAQPVTLEIGEITGKILKLKAAVANTGDLDATDVNWNITVDGKLVFLGKESSGVVDIPAGEEVTLTSKPLFGLGKVVITVTVGDVEKEVEGTLLFVLILL